MTAPGPGLRGAGYAAHQRVVAQLLGWLAVLSAPAWGTSAWRQVDDVALWWVLLVEPLLAVAVLGLFVAALRPGIDRGAAAGVLVTVVAVAVLTWGFAVPDGRWEQAQSPWLWLIFPLTYAALAIRASLLLSVAYVVVIGGVYEYWRLLPGSGRGDLYVVPSEWGLMLALATAAALLVKASLAAAARLDRDAAEAATAGREASRAAAVAQARAEADALVHDSVLSALLAADRAPGSPDVAPMAGRALTVLARAAKAAHPPGPVPAAEVAARLENATQLIAPGATVCRCEGPPVPPAVAHAFVEAVAEAARNAVRHASPDSGGPRLSVAVGGERTLCVTVADDGPGFRPAEVPPDRLGLAVSVVGRLRSVGGDVEVDTAPGAGTRIHLWWPAAAGERRPGCGCGA